MGRHRLKKSDSMIAAQKKKWAKKRNARRRQQYASDPKYRDSINQRNRSSYRDTNGVEMRNCAKNIDKLNKFGKVRVIRINKKETRECLTLNVHELASALGGYHHIVLYRWHRQKKFPKSEFEVVDARAYPPLMVYTENQAKLLLHVMSQHQREKLYLHDRDAETIKGLFAAMAIPFD
jgi:hypothetical protein